MATQKSPASQDAIELLKADHKEVKELFKQYETMAEGDAGPEEKQQIAETICAMLTVHATIEEELLYPQAKNAIDDVELVNEANVEHASAKELIAQIQGMSPAEELYDAKVKVLGEYINHHVEEEEGELFPQVKKAGIDVKALGSRLAKRKEELLAGMAEPG